MSTSQTPAPAGDTQGLRLLFDEGTILVEGLVEGDDQGVPGVQFNR